MQSHATHFFVATLADAQHLNSANHHGISTVSELLVRRAGTTPDAVAVGVRAPTPVGHEKHPWGAIVYTYAELLNSVNATAFRLSGSLPPAKQVPGTANGPTVAMLSESSVDFLMCFLGLIKMGYTVLLIAPQCDSHAIRHLLSTTSSILLLHSPALAKLASFSLPPECACGLLPVHNTKEDIAFSCDYMATPGFVNSSTVAYIHHTSGTTSGLPTPIPQLHASATYHLPVLPPPKPVSTLTMTPLYHGGAADLMRSMMSRSMIWLFPHTVPITTQNIVCAINTANATIPVSPVRLFTAVPYIQRMCLENKECLRALRDMDIVGYGGAQLPEAVGNALVANGVNLVSRFGSTECGFLMSSFRDFKVDKAWNYLRLSATSQKITFEPKGDGTSELVVNHDWPHMAKRNRPDGSFATSDIFIQHPNVPGAYKYSTRSDSTVVLINGKKFDPTPIEDELKKLGVIDEAIVFGQNRERPGVMVFRSSRPVVGRASDMVNRAIQNLNARSPPHARILPELILYMRHGTHWPKSSKGTALRIKAEDVFKADIDHMWECYEKADPSNDSKVGTEDGQVLERVVSNIVEQIVDRRLGSDEDFFMAGVDSMQATAIRKKLLDKVNMKEPLPTNAVFEQQNIRGLSKFLTTVKGIDPEKKHELDSMRGMVDRFTNINTAGATDGPQVVIITGVTGALGAHLLHSLIEVGVRKIICLVRASSAPEATTRLLDSLKRRRLPATWNPARTIIQACASSLSERYLGLPEPLYLQMASEATLIIHAAWPVNFLAPLPSFDSALAGTRNLLDLAHARRRKRFVFCSSTASVIRSASPILEKLSESPESAAPLGYSRSKWVAEQIVRRAGGQVVRLGQLSGDTKAGVWNAEEGWPLILMTFWQVGFLPELQEKVQWLPVDIAARAIIRIGLGQSANHDIGIWHVLNTNAIEWSKILDSMELWWGKGDLAKARVSPDVWVKELEEFEAKGGTVKLLGLWKSLYGKETAGSPMAREPVFEVNNVDGVDPGFKDGVEIGNAYLHRVFDGLEPNERSERLVKRD